MSKFLNNLLASNDGIKKQRAEAIADIAKLEFETLVNEKKREVMSLQSRKERLKDLGPDTTESLRPGGVDFNAKDWATNLATVSVNLEATKLELEVLMNEFVEEFTESK